MITQSELKQLLHYDPQTGWFTWLVCNSNRAAVGSPAGATRPDGYVKIGLHGKPNLAHRLAWLYVYGDWPSKHLDHINGIRNDNRICNLREASTLENNLNKGLQSNNTSGQKGVYWDKVNQKWYARGKVSGKSHHLGRFKSFSEASSAFQLFAKQHYGEFYRHAADFTLNDPSIAETGIIKPGLETPMIREATTA